MEVLWEALLCRALKINSQSKLQSKTSTRSTGSKYRLREKFTNIPV